MTIKISPFLKGIAVSLAPEYKKLIKRTNKFELMCDRLGYDAVDIKNILKNASESPYDCIHAALTYRKG